jgi:hypothetical protein
MKKIIHKIRSKSPEMRFAIALVLALILTGAIAAVWIIEIFHHAPVPIQDQEETASAAVPTPFSALVSSVKGEVGSLKTQKGTPADSSGSSDPSTSSATTVQIIDASSPQPSSK